MEIILCGAGIAAVLLFQPRDEGGSIEAPGVGEDDFVRHDVTLSSVDGEG